MSRVLYFDSAASSPWSFKLGITDERQPTLIRLAWWCPPGDQICKLVRARTLSVQAESLVETVQEFVDALAGADEVACFNADFHQRMMERSAIQTGIHLEWPRRPICLMREATPIVRKRRQSGGGWSYPKLGEAYGFFTHREFMTDDMTNPAKRGRYMVGCLQEIHAGILDARNDSAA